jgi:hypothetical protein
MRNQQDQFPDNSIIQIDFMPYEVNCILHDRCKIAHSEAFPILKKGFLNSQNSKKLHYIQHTGGVVYNNSHQKIPIFSIVLLMVSSTVQGDLGNTWGMCIKAIIYRG